jgi:hypothetical protein
MTYSSGMTKNSGLLLEAMISGGDDGKLAM